MFYSSADGLRLIGSSPEVVGLGGRHRDAPAGRHAPRGADAQEDRALAAELLADPKERATRHAVDLARNDVGRSGVRHRRAPTLFEVERYPM